MKYSILLGMVFLISCSEKIEIPTSTQHQNQTFVSVSDAATRITIGRDPSDYFMVFMDVELEANMFSDKTAEYIFSPKFEIAISIPKNVSSITKSWQYEKCTFLPSPYNKLWPNSDREYFSFQSICLNTRTRNKYLVTKSGCLVAFELSEIDEQGNIINNIIYVAADR